MCREQATELHWKVNFSLYKDAGKIWAAMAGGVWEDLPAS